MLQADSVCYRVGPHRILEGISLELEAGQIYGLLGPNGAGKSTLLRLLAGELTPSEGSIQVQGRPLEAWPPSALAQRRAVLPQQSLLTFDYRVREVVALGRSPYYKAPHEHVRGREVTSLAMEQVGIRHLSDRAYTTLSGGEKQRVHLARVLTQIWDPPEDGARYLLLDEPTAGLDLAHQFALLEQVCAFARERTAVVFSLHDLNLAARFTDQLIVLKEGRLHAFGETGNTLSAELVNRVFSVGAEILPASGLRDTQVCTYPLDT